MRITSTKRRYAVALAALCGGLLAAAPAQAAAPGHATDFSPREVRQYWTPERMEAAIPADALLAGVPAPSALVPAEDGESRVVAPARGILGGGDGTRDAQLIANPRQAPFRTHGKVFFTLNNVPYVCSGTVIASETKRLVVTAGHCVHSAASGYATRWEFVPAYDQGDAPFGEWVASRLATTRQWRENEDIRYDVGIARMAKRNDRRIQAVVGARGIGFNRHPARYHAYGYPAEDPYGGGRLYMCDSPDQGSDQQEQPPRPRRIECDMTGGSSGGGWVVRERFVNSVVSYGYECVGILLPCENPDRGKLFGPYFGDTIQRLYRRQNGG